MVGPSWAPLAQSRPRLAAASSTPRTRRTLPSAPSKRRRQPTPQYGQTDSPITGTIRVSPGSGGRARRADRRTGGGLQEPAPGAALLRCFSACVLSQMTKLGRGELAHCLVLPRAGGREADVEGTGKGSK